MDKLIRAERETIIRFDEEDDEATIFTYLKSWQNHLEKKLGLKPIMDNGFGGKEYKIDKSRIRPPHKKSKRGQHLLKANNNSKNHSSMQKKSKKSKKSGNHPCIRRIASGKKKKV